MSSNKNARKELERLYGKECFIDKLHLRPESEQRHYTGKAQLKKMRKLTYHHILERRNGGKTTVENGAILSVSNHSWFNEQSPQKQAEMNKAFQEYKLGVSVLTSQRIIKPQSIKIDMSETITIKLKPSRETTKQRRAKEKQELRKIWEELDYEEK